MQWKNKLVVPKGVRYLSQWKGFNFRNFPSKHIINKQLPGCGFTEFALTCPENVVLASPRKMLMNNKKDQHGDDVYLVVNQYEIDTDVDEDVSKPLPTPKLEEKDKYFLEMLQKQTEELPNLYTHLYQEISQYMERMRIQEKPAKIIVTYDSTYLVKRILESMGVIDSFWFAIDEFQSFLDDSRFKSTTELQVLSTLQDIKNVSYVSATPMLDKYLEQISEFRFLPYYELDWKTEDPTRIKKSNLKVRTMSSVGSKMEEIIQSYLQGKFEKAVVEREENFVEVESREAVFYVNSVNHIINIIKRCNLSPDQVNILCSDTPYNRKRIERKLGKKKGYSVGTVPLKGEPHKMFTFCTRTVYLGADFYSTCARSFIFSDANSDCLAIDISIDLYQILGRERLDENPWKNSAEFFYRATCDDKKMTQEDFQKILKNKIEKTNNLLEAYIATPDKAKSSLSETYEYVAKSDKYKMNYVAVNKQDNGDLIPVFNNLGMINDQRAFDIQQVDYADRFSVFTSISSNNSLDLGKENFIDEFFCYYDQLSTYVDKIHCIVDYLIEFPEREKSIINNLVDSDKIKQQLVTLGASRIKGLSYNLTRVNKAMGITIFDKTQFIKEVYQYFIPGQRYTKKYIKEKLGELYKKMDYNGTPKASDMEKWFVIKSIQITNPTTKKRDPGFEIISKK